MRVCDSRSRRTFLAAAIATGALAASAAAETQKPRIVIVATGGTIAGAASSTTSTGYRAAALAVDVLIAAVPQLRRFADVRGVQVAGMSPDLIDAAVANGARGLVIAGVGDGNMTAPALEAVKRAIARGLVVVRSTRVGQGIVRRNIEIDDDAIRTVVSRDLVPSKARVLLKLALTKTTDPRRIQEFFDTY